MYVWSSMVWHGMAWHGMVWCGVEWSGVVWYGCMYVCMYIGTYVCMYVCLGLRMHARTGWRASCIPNPTVGRGLKPEALVVGGQIQSKRETEEQLHNLVRLESVG